MPSAQVQSRAVQLVRENRVHPLVVEIDACCIAAVQGDHGHYLTTVLDPGYINNLPLDFPPRTPLCSCTCEAGHNDTMCSHVTACAALLETTRDDGFEANRRRAIAALESREETHAG